MLLLRDAIVMSVSEAADHSRVFAEVGDPVLLTRFRFVLPVNTGIEAGDKVDLEVRNIRVSKTGSLMFEGQLHSRKPAEAPKA